MNKMQISAVRLFCFYKKLNTKNQKKKNNYGNIILYEFKIIIIELSKLSF